MSSNRVLLPDPNNHVEPSAAASWCVTTTLTSSRLCNSHNPTTLRSHRRNRPTECALRLHFNRPSVNQLTHSLHAFELCLQLLFLMLVPLPSTDVILHSTSSPLGGFKYSFMSTEDGLKLQRSGPYVNNITLPRFECRRRQTPRAAAVPPPQYNSDVMRFLGMLLLPLYVLCASCVYFRKKENMEMSFFGCETPRRRCFSTAERLVLNGAQPDLTSSARQKGNPKD